jgi:hypothetical protein
MSPLRPVFADSDHIADARHVAKVPIAEVPSLIRSPRGRERSLFPAVGTQLLRRKDLTASKSPGANALLISTRSLRSRWRVGVAFDAAMIDEKYRTAHWGITDARDRSSWHDRRPSGVCLLRPDPCGDVELHSAAECFVAQMRICDLRVRIVRDGHEPNEAEEQRPRCVPIEPVHVISSPKDRREQKGYQNSVRLVKITGVTFAGANPLFLAREAIIAKGGHALEYRMAVTTGLAFCQHHRRAFSILRHRSRWQNIGHSRATDHLVI